MSARPSIVRGTLLLTGTNLFLRAVSLVFQVYLSNRVGAAGLGLLQLVLTVGLLAMTVGSSGVRTACMYLCAQEFGRGRLGGVGAAVTACLRWGLFFSVTAGAVLFFSAEAIAVSLLGDVRCTKALRLLAIFLPATGLCGNLSGYLTACGKLKAMVSIDFLERFVSIGVTLVLLYRAQSDIADACAAIVAGSSGAAVVSFVFQYALYRHDRRGFGSVPAQLHMGKRLVRLCTPLALNDYLRSGLSSLEQFLIPRGLALCLTAQAGLEAYGRIHGMVFPVIMFPAAILYALADLLVPELSHCTAAKNRRRIDYLTGRCLFLGGGFAFGCAAFFYLAGPLLGTLLYNSTEAGSLIRLFAPMLLFLYPDAVVDGMLKGLGQQVACVRYNTLTSFLDVVLLYFLLPRLGIAGYVFSFASTHLINFFFSFRRLLVVTGWLPRRNALLFWLTNPQFWHTILKGGFPPKLIQKGVNSMDAGSSNGSSAGRSSVEEVPLCTRGHSQIS